MIKRFDRTASLALVSAMTVLSGALMALLGSAGPATTVHAIERGGLASLPVEAPTAPAADLVLQPAPVARLSEAADPEGLTALLEVVDDRTGLRVRDVSVRVGDRVHRVETRPGVPIALDLDATVETLEVGAPGYAPRLVAAVGSSTEEVRLVRCTTVRGVVRDSLGAPMARASVRLVREGEPGAVDLATTLRRTDGAGAYAFDALPPGTYRTVVEANGRTHRSRAVQVGPGEWSEVDHRLPAAATLAVIVDGPDGVPAERARLLLTRADGDVLRTAYTDADGRAEVSPLLPGAYELRVQSVDGTAPHHPLTIQEGDQGLVDLRIQLSCPASGPLDRPRER